MDFLLVMRIANISEATKKGQLLEINRCETNFQSKNCTKRNDYQQCVRVPSCVSDNLHSVQRIFDRWRDREEFESIPGDEREAIAISM